MTPVSPTSCVRRPPASVYRRRHDAGVPNFLRSSPTRLRLSPSVRPSMFLRSMPTAVFQLTHRIFARASWTIAHGYITCSSGTFTHAHFLPPPLDPHPRIRLPSALRPVHYMYRLRAQGHLRASPRYLNPASSLRCPSTPGMTRIRPPTRPSTRRRTHRSNTLRHSVSDHGLAIRPVCA
jgi:hypothetical protein